MNDNMFSTSSVEANLRDESGLIGFADSIAFPKNSKELALAVTYAHEQQLKITVQGAKTGICGGAVPFGGAIINLSEMKSISGFSLDKTSFSATITVDCGVTLEHLNKTLTTKNIDITCLDKNSADYWQEYKNTNIVLYFPPNPSETSATIGGICATNATGSHIFSGADTRNFVQNIEIVTPTGEKISFNNKDDIACLSHTITPEKNIQNSLSAGYYTQGSIIDFYCGSEGTAGIISQATLKLSPTPPLTWGIMAFFEDCVQMSSFLDLLKDKSTPAQVEILSLDLFDNSCMKILSTMKDSITGLGSVPDFGGEFSFAVWTEFSGDLEESMMEFLETALEILEEVHAPADLALAATDYNEFSRLQGLRHGLTEAANILTSGKQSFLLDVVIPMDRYMRLVDIFSRQIALHDFPAIIMGYAGTGHLTIHLMPENQQHITTCINISDEITKALLENGCECACTYGVGRIKKELFHTLSKEKAENTMQVKAAIDPGNIINSGILADSL